MTIRTKIKIAYQTHRVRAAVVYNDTDQATDAIGKGGLVNKKGFSGMNAMMQNEAEISLGATARIPMREILRGGGGAITTPELVFAQRYVSRMTDVADEFLRTRTLRPH